MTVRLLLDTDIGSDVDDELALTMLLGSPEVELLGLTTSYGDVRLRARIARRLTGMTGAQVPVVPGEPAPLSGREVWWAGHEGAGYPDLDAVPVSDGRGTEFLADQVARRSGQVDILGIAPLTTLATAVRHHPELAGGVARVTVMGGHFSAGPAGEPEHNIVSDLDAARVVLATRWPVTMIGLEITRRVRLSEADLVRVHRSGPLGEVLGDAARAWMRRWDEDFEVPHDPVAALTLIRPDLFTFSDPGRVEIDDAGRTILVVDPAGTTRIALTIDAEAAAAEVLARVIAGITGRSTAMAVD